MEQIWHTITSGVPDLGSDPRNNGVNSATPGMQICIRTFLGRIGLLTIDPGTNNNQLQVTATIWGS